LLSIVSNVIIDIHTLTIGGSMFEIKYNKDYAIALREHGFSATEISEFLGCSVSWLYNVVKIKPDEQKRKALMQYVVERHNEEV